MGFTCLLDSTGFLGSTGLVYILINHLFQLITQPRFGFSSPSSTFLENCLSTDQDLEILSLKPLLHIRTITQNCTRQYLGWVVGDYGTWFKDPLLRYFLDDKLVGVQELVTGRQGAAAGSQGSALPPVAAAASNCSPQSLPTCFTTCVGSLNRKPL